MTTKVILDTDIGSDIDDAACLAYLLAQPECELLGITTVTGHGLERAKIASALCKRAGKSVPIYIGAEVPFIIAQRQPEAPQAAALDKWEHDSEFPRGEAVEFLRRTIRENPHEIVLLTIGPLTNIALLFAADPEIPSLLKGLVLMGGSFWADHNGGREWNIILDPHASEIVYRAKPPYHRSIGLDVTMQVKMDAGEVRERFQNGMLRPVLDFAEIWFSQASKPPLIFHDPLASATIFDDSICGFEKGRVSINLEAGDMLGKTDWFPGDESGHHEVATTVDAARFFEEYFGTLS